MPKGFCFIKRFLVSAKYFWPWDPFCYTNQHFKKLVFFSSHFDEILCRLAESSHSVTGLLAKLFFDRWVWLLYQP